VLVSGYGDRVTDGKPVLDVPLARLRERRSAKWQTFPADVLPLTIAEMDVELAEPVAAALRQAVAASDTGYGYDSGELLAAYQAAAGPLWGWDAGSLRLTAVTDVGVGVTELLRVLAGPGARVLLNSPVYPPFYGWVREAGCEFEDVPLRRTGTGWRLDLDRVEAALRARPAAYLLCNPHNPVGRAHTADELSQVIRLGARYGVPLIADEIHAPLVLSGHRVTPVLSLPEAAPVAFAVTSASKAWNLAGLKCAFVLTASDATGDQVRRLPPDTRWRFGHLGMIASVAAYRDGTGWLTRLRETLTERRDLVGELLRAHLPALTWNPPEASFLAWLDCTALGDGDAVAQRFAESAKVAVEGGARFGGPGRGYIRLNFATSEEILRTALQRMGAVFSAG
jgi:cystathionine beta-lyase